ncbi:hypothetical protein COU37_01260 [Candidatus Micrarchaeota archaeon CG10_big_fil_rev_8_21_14_0_10_45_29]|nr:MAG: hypothetical protein COU37_01260 [Candidatus Micrarchaeota archaeon CG10_big_fil_rev_8_21_14_0_10_45_29]
MSFAKPEIIQKCTKKIDGARQTTFNNHKYPEVYCQLIKNIKNRNSDRSPPFRHFLPVFEELRQDREKKPADFLYTMDFLLKGIAEINSNYLTDYNKVIVDCIRNATKSYVDNKGVEHFAQRAKKLQTLTMLAKSELYAKNKFCRYVLGIKEDIIQEAEKLFQVLKEKSYSRSNELKGFVPQNGSPLNEIAQRNFSFEKYFAEIKETPIPDSGEKKTMVASDIMLYFDIAIPRLKTIGKEYNENSYADQVFSCTFDCMETIYAGLYISFDAGKEIMYPYT